MDYEIAMALRHTEFWAEVRRTGTRLYEVSTFGRRKITSLRTNKILKLDYGLGGRYKNFGGSLGCAHRVIAEAFIPKPFNQPQVNHVDGNKANNHISNLEWMTASENTLHAFDNGLIDKAKMSKSATERTLRNGSCITVK